MSRFSFEPDLALDRVTGKWDFCYRPYIFVELMYKKRRSSYPLRALVDSGSDHNIFPSEFAREIGLDYKNEIKYKTTTVNEYAFTVYGNRVKLVIRDTELETIIYFGDNVKIPILGRNGFFNYYKKVSFFVKNKTFELVK